MHEEWGKKAMLMHSLKGHGYPATEEPSRRELGGKNGTLKLVRKRARQCLNFPQDVRNVKSKV